MNTWGFSDDNGNELTAGWQGYEDQARAYAQDLANRRGAAVSFYLFGSDTSEVVEPEK